MEQFECRTLIKRLDDFFFFSPNLTDAVSAPIFSSPELTNLEKSLTPLSASRTKTYRRLRPLRSQHLHAITKLHQQPPSHHQKTSHSRVWEKIPLSPSQARFGWRVRMKASRPRNRPRQPPLAINLQHQIL